MYNGGFKKGSCTAHNMIILLNVIQRQKSLGKPGGGVLPYLGMVGRFLDDDPRFSICNLIGSLLYSVNPIDLLFLQTKINLSLSHLVPEILGLKVGLIFHQMYYLTYFKHLVSIFS